MQTKDEMNDHIKALHGTSAQSDVQFVCGHCNHEFVKETEYISHVRKHKITPANIPDPAVSVNKITDKI